MVDCRAENLILRCLPRQTLFVGSEMFQTYEDYDWVSNTLSSMSRTCNSFPPVTDKNVDVTRRLCIQTKDEQSQFNETAAGK
jgi:hypothetical protein